MRVLKLFLPILTIYIYLLFIDVNCELTEQEMDDLENDMVISLKKFKKSNNEENLMRDKLCKRNLKSAEWEKVSNYCFQKAIKDAKCLKCKMLFIKSYDTCNKKVPYINGCSEVVFNKRGACQVEFFENNRQEILLEYKTNKEDFFKMINIIDNCYWEVVNADFAGVL